MKGLGPHTIIEKERNENFEYSKNDIDQEIQKIRNEEAFLNRFVTEDNLNVKIISYEDVVRDRTYINEIGYKVGCFQLALKERRLKKVSGNTSRDWIKKYKEHYRLPT
jgi:LPS sulfotransferase NodH